jgi:hypothetical protein
MVELGFSDVHSADNWNSRNYGLDIVLLKKTNTKSISRC